MGKRFVAIWFRQLKTDWFSIRQPVLREKEFVLVTPDHGRMMITGANELAIARGIEFGMVVSDARALVPALEVLDDPPGLAEKILGSIAVWCIRFTNIVSVDLPDGVVLDATGAAHLWGGEKAYIKNITACFENRGYQVRIAMADTIGAAWAVAHYGGSLTIVDRSGVMDIVLPLPPAALRLEIAVVERLHKLGLFQIRNFIGIPRAALRRRFGKEMLLKLDQAFGREAEPILSVEETQPFRERLPCLDPIVTATGIEIALQRLLEAICKRLQQEDLGIRKAVFTGIRIDGKSEKIEIGTHRATQQVQHLYKLFAEKISTMEPGLGIELFMIEALKTDKCIASQEKLWSATTGLENPSLAEFMDRLSNRFGEGPVKRFLPAEHYLPEKSFIPCYTLQQVPVTQWMLDRPRPLQLLSRPQPIEVAAPVPDYPPMNFRYQGKLHIIKKADGPERIEQEWWLKDGPHRDYYAVEDESGNRYWLFRSGHYREEKKPKWFVHGFFS